MGWGTQRTRGRHVRRRMQPPGMGCGGHLEECLDLVPLTLSLSLLFSKLFSFLLFPFFMNLIVDDLG